MAMSVLFKSEATGALVKQQLQNAQGTFVDIWELTDLELP